MKVLIVEPSKNLAKVVKSALEQKGISAQVASSAQGGISEADRSTPDLVLLELLLRKNNGLEFIHEFKSYPEWFYTPIIIYSDLPYSELFVEDPMLKEMNIIEYFYKPETSLEKLVNRISEVED